MIRQTDRLTDKVIDRGAPKILTCIPEQTAPIAKPR